MTPAKAVHLQHGFSPVLQTGRQSVVINRYGGFAQAYELHIGIMPTLRGFRPFCFDEYGNVDFVGSEKLPLAPQETLTFLWMVDGVKHLHVHHDDEVKQFNDIALMLGGYLDDRSTRSVARSVGFTVPEIQDMMNYFPGPKELSIILNACSDDNGRMFRQAIPAMAPYMMANGDISEKGYSWLRDHNLL